MSYPQLSQHNEIRQSYIADVYDLAHYIENSLGPVLRPVEAGIYLPDQLEPVLRPDRRYWYQEPVATNQVQQHVPVRSDISMWGDTTRHYGDIYRTHNQAWQYYRYKYTPVMRLEDVLSSPWDIVEMEYNFIPPYFSPDDEFPGTDIQPKSVALPHHLIQQALLQPDLPVRGIRIAKAILEDEVAASRSFNRRAALSMEEIVLPFIDERFLPPTRDAHQSLDATWRQFMRNDPWFQSELISIFENMLISVPIRYMLKNNGYQICDIQYRSGFTLQIDMLGDYRILEYDRINADPEYHRWLRAKQDGSWDRFMETQNENQARSSATDPYRY